LHSHKKDLPNASEKGKKKGKREGSQYRRSEIKLTGETGEGGGAGSTDIRGDKERASESIKRQKNDRPEKGNGT